MTRVRASNPALLLLAIQRHGEHGNLVGPKCAFEFLSQFLRFGEQFLTFLIKTEVLGGDCDSGLCRIYIRLNFTQGNRALRQSSIIVKNGILRILPSLLKKTAFGMTGILNKAVPIYIAGTIDPIKRSLNVLPNVSDKFAVVCSLVVHRGEENKQGR